MASLFESLPPEMVQKCVEFLPFAEVHAEVKSDAQGGAADARPVEAVPGEQALAAVSY